VKQDLGAHVTKVPLVQLSLSSLLSTFHTTLEAIFPPKRLSETEPWRWLCSQVVVFVIPFPPLQSSSIFTSALTPLVGVGVVHIDRMYPLTLGANIGTTITAILASLTADSSKLYLTLQVALCHLFFNVIGIIIWYPVPAMRKVPLGAAKALGESCSCWRSQSDVLDKSFISP
jgi:hypothetical protein